MIRASAFLAALLVASACTSREKPASFANAPVILISVDTLRSDHLPAYGYDKVETPHIDALRRDAVLFERAYSQCPMTLPSHLSMFTGLLPGEHGVRNNIGYRFDRARHKTLAEALREAKYATGAAVSSYVLRSETGVDDGFDFYEDSIPVATAGAASEHQRSGSATLSRALPWLAAQKDQPYFFFFHIYEPHAPYAPPEPYRSRYAEPYDGEIAAADAIVGELISNLKAAGVYDRAVVIFLSDHGEGLWDHGEDQHGILLYREALQVPLLIKLPRSERGGSSESRPVSLADVFPTVLDAVGIAQSQSLLRPAEKTKPIYSETLYPRIHLGWSELRSQIEDRYHYIEGPRGELYDLIADPGETRDLVATDRRVAAKLRRDLETIPTGDATLQAIDPEEAAKLAALGYVGTPQQRSGPLPNPRDQIGQLKEIKLAFHLAEQRRYDEAARAFRDLLSKNPKLADVASKLGEVLVSAGRYDEAIAAYKSAISNSERFSPDLALSLGFAYLKAGKPTDAASHAELALNSNPRQAHELLARTAIETGDVRGAVQHARDALAVGDRQPTTFLVLAEAFRAGGQFREALETANAAEQRARELGVERLYGLDYLRGDLLARLDQPDEAIAAYRREIANFPEDLQAWANLAIIHMIQGETAKANAILEQMVNSNPSRAAYLLAAKTVEAFGDKKGAARWRSRAAP